MGKGVFVENEQKISEISEIIEIYHEVSMQKKLDEINKITFDEMSLIISNASTLLDCVKFYARDRNFSKQLNEEFNITGIAKQCLEKLDIKLED